MVTQPHPEPGRNGSITVTADQVDNARLLLALDRASGVPSEEWLVRLANATVPARTTPAVPTTPTDVRDLQLAVAELERRVAVLEAQLGDRLRTETTG